MTTVKKAPVRRKKPSEEIVIDIEPINKAPAPQVEAHEISTKTQRAEDRGWPRRCAGQLSRHRPRQLLAGRTRASAGTVPETQQHAAADNHRARR